MTQSEEHQVAKKEQPSINSRSSFCFNCGYDLTGLPLPRPCPECGQLCDPDQDVRNARACFANNRNPFFLLRRLSKVPIGLHYALHDSQSCRIARRREFYWLYLPSLITFLLVLTGIFISVEYEVKIWNYQKGDTDRKVLREVTEIENDRLFGFNLHIFRGGFFYKNPPNWVEVVERTKQGVQFGLPEYFEVLYILLGIIPLIIVLFGYGLADIAILCFSKRVVQKYGLSEMITASHTAFTLMAPLIGLSLWGWVVLAFLNIPIQNLSTVDNIVIILCIAPLSWILFSLFGTSMLIKNDRAHCIYKHRLLSWLMINALLIIPPTFITWLLLIFVDTL